MSFEYAFNPLTGAQDITNKVKSNRNATVEPTVNDDASAGYSAGSEWVIPSQNLIWKCSIATIGSAQWHTMVQQEGEAVPPGGFEGQVLVKTSDVDLQTGWADRGSLTYSRTAVLGLSQEAGSAFARITVPKDCYLRSIAVFLDDARTAGTLQIKPRRNGAALTNNNADILIDASSPSSKTVTTQRHESGMEFSAGDVLDLFLVTIAFEPLAQTVEISLFLEE